MKNFTKQNFKTNPLWIRLLIMTFMLLAGAGNTWAVDYWVVGPAVGGWDQWKQMNPESTTRYTFTVNTGEFKITKAKNWDNANRLDNIGCNDNNDTYKGNVTCNGANNHSANVAGTLCFNPNDSYMWIESSGTPSTGLTRIVAGTPASVFGTEWDPGNQENKMTKTGDGIYTIDYYTNFQSNTTIKFKVTDGSWSNAWPSDDKSHTISEGCQKTTVTYKTNGNTVDVSTVPSNHCCSAPTSVSITRSDAPSTAHICQGSTLNLRADVSGGNGDIKYEWEMVEGTDWSVSANSTEQTCTVTAGTGEAKFKIQATQCEKTVEATITLTADAKPSLELASSPTVCPNVQIDLDNYINLSIGTVTWYYDDNRANVITDGLVTPTEQTTYYASASNGVCESKESELIVKVYEVPEDMPAYTSTPATSCKRTPNSDGTITLKNAVGGVTYALDGTNGTKWSGLAAGTHKLSATVDACSSLTREWDIEVGEEDITPSATVTISGEASFCEGTSTELTCVVNATKGNPTAYQWYNGDNLIQDAINSTYSARAEGNYKVVVTVLNSTCQEEFWSDEKVVTINPKPNEPVLSIPSPICAGSNFTLPEEDNNQRNITWNVNDRELTNLTAGEHNYTAKIIDVNGCESNEVTYTITVTALPEITSISQDIKEPVFYEDVTLTATATEGATVKWYEGGEEKGEGLTYVVTSETATSKTITAKAFLNGCESAEASHPVTFSAEDCNSTTRTDLIITCNPNGYYGDVYLHIWPNGEGSLTGWPGYKGDWKDNVWRWEISASLLSTSKQYDIIFNNNAGAQTQNLDHNLIPGNQYNYTLNHTDWGNGNNRPTMGKVDPIPLSQPAPISAPAAKTISVSTTEGEGNIIFSGQVVKTGCDATNEYGFQYSSDEQTWTTVKVGENAAAGTVISNNTVIGLDGTYYVRAYITNDNSTQYGAITEITVSTKKTAITSVVLTHVKDVNGTAYEDQELENLTYCVGDEVWFELNYVGSTFIPENNVGFKWTTYPGNGLIGAYNGNKYKFTITGSGTIGISLRNDANVDGEGNPTWAESNLLEFNTHPEPTAPYISIDPASGIICEGSTATIKVENPSTDCSYKLVEVGSKAGFTPYKSGDLTYTVENVGKYYVVAQHNECTANEYTSNQVAINQIISTSATISIEPNNPETTPWEPVTITVKPAAGYIYELTYTDGNLAAVDGVRIKQNGDSYTYYIPRPDDWTTGDATPVRKTVNYGIKAQLKVDGEASECKLNYATATIQLKDEDNENCLK